MAIVAVAGGAVSNTTATTTLVLPSFNAVVGDVVMVAIALANTSLSVSSLADTATTPNTYTPIAASTSSTQVRTELWSTTITTAKTGDVITVNLSGSSLGSAAFEQYSGVTATVIGNTGTSNGQSWRGSAAAVTQDFGNYVICATGFTSVSGLVIGRENGSTLRQSVVPSVTSVGVALVEATASPQGTLAAGLFFNSVTSQYWSCVAAEIRTHAAAAVINLPPISFPVYLTYNIEAASPGLLTFIPPPRDSPAVIGGGNTSY